MSTISSTGSVLLQGVSWHLVGLVNRRTLADETTLLREFRAACQRIAGGAGNAASE